ncbi:MAG: PAS domain-containing protein, partial [Bdellovibrionaceae bacterium]|nr:PAS domain-containing protein [Pseudobdellovibrionaceae bacterium]
MKSNDHLRFLDAAGELPLRIREFDWTTTPLGPPDAWPQSLKTTVGLMLRSKFPTFITWGTERIVLYNDAYRPILGTQKHPTALGARLHDIWQEVWNDIEPIILASERTQATSFEDFPLRLLRNGYWEQAYFTFSYSPIFDESGVLCGLHCTCFETTERKSHDDEQERDFQKGLKSREELGELSDSIPQLVWMTGPNGRSEYFNRRWLEYTGVNANQGVQYEDILHPDDIEATRTAWQTSVQTGKPFLVEYRLKHKATGQYRW